MATSTITNPNEASVLSEANGQRSREKVVVVSGAGVLEAGTVLGKITAGGKYQAYDNGDSPAGIGVASAVLLYGVDATAADVSAATIARDAEVVAELLRFKSGTTLTNANLAKTDLAAVGVVVRGDWTQTFPIP
jgi:hypothetical protein